VRSGSLVQDNVYAVDGLVEKPSREEAPSNLVIASRYILPPEIFSALETTPPGKNNEIQLTDALKMLLQDSAIYGVKFDGIRHDMGNKLDFIKTTIHYGLGHPEFGEELKVWLKSLDLN
jgi:UTP--glucose-1-phosphate uridylyltransferase